VTRCRTRRGGETAHGLSLTRHLADLLLCHFRTVAKRRIGNSGPHLIAAAPDSRSDPRSVENHRENDVVRPSRGPAAGRRDRRGRREAGTIARHHSKFPPVSSSMVSADCSICDSCSASGDDDVRLAFARAPEAINERGRLGRRGSIRPIETLQRFLASDQTGVEERVVRAIDELIVFTPRPQGVAVRNRSTGRPRACRRASRASASIHRLTRGGRLPQYRPPH
jgi:hypothetical protein